MPEQVHHYGMFEINYGRNPNEILVDGEGWFSYSDVVDLLRTKRAYMTQTRSIWDKTNYSNKIWKHARGGYVWKDFIISDVQGLKGIFLRPYVVYFDEATCRSEFDFSIYDYVEGENLDQNDQYDFVTSADGKFTEMVHGTGFAFSLATSSGHPYLECQPTQITWNPPDKLCPNLFFAVGIRRQGLDEDGTVGVEAAADEEIDGPMDKDQWFWTRIFFGGTPRVWGGESYSGGFRWCLFIPLSGEPYLEQGFYANSGDRDGLWVKRPFTTGSLSHVEPRSMATQGKTYFIGVIKDHIVISENGFEQGFAAYRANDCAQPLVPEGAVRVNHWPGQCAIWLAPLAFRDWGEGYTSGIGGSMYQDNLRLELIGDRYWVYGYTVKGYQATDALVWIAEAPDWWPGAHEWWEVKFEILDMEFTESFEAPPVWPPYGPPGEWPAWAPPGWPEGEAWPPVDESGVIRKCPDGVNPLAGLLTGGDIDFWYYQSSEDDYYLNWEIAVLPNVWTPGGTYQKTYSTPFIEAFSVWQAPWFEAELPGSYVEPAVPHSVTISEGELEQNTSCNAEVVLDNVKGNYGYWPSEYLRPGSVCKVTAGVQYDTVPDVEYVTHAGLILVEAQPGPTEVGCHFTDPLGMLQLAKWDRGDINFKLWPSYGAIWQLGAMYGIPDSMWDLEDLGEVLKGDWTWTLGTGIFQIMSDIATRGQRNAALWFDPLTCKIKSGCRYCGAKRTPYSAANVGKPEALHDWISHQDNGWNSNGCVHEDRHRTSTDADEDPWERDYRNGTGIDFELLVDPELNGASLQVLENFAGKQGKLTSSEYANRVMAEGKTFDGYPIRMWKSDLKSIGSDGVEPFPPNRYVGWRVTKVENVQGEGTWDLLDQKLHEMDAAFGNRRIETPPITLPFFYSLRPRHVVKIYGGEWVPNANEAKFRVTSVQHAPQEHRTTIKLRQMIGEDD